MIFQKLTGKTYVYISSYSCLTRATSSIIGPQEREVQSDRRLGKTGLNLKDLRWTKKERRRFQADKIACIRGLNLFQNLNALWFGDRKEILCGKVEAREKSLKVNYEGLHVINQWT